VREVEEKEGEDAEDPEGVQKASNCVWLRAIRRWRMLG
jgi:hypothetical protein